MVGCNATPTAWKTLPVDDAEACFPHDNELARASMAPIIASCAIFLESFCLRGVIIPNEQFSLFDIIERVNVILLNFSFNTMQHHFLNPLHGFSNLFYFTHYIFC